jgi:hypothetical protein
VNTSQPTKQSSVEAPAIFNGRRNGFRLEYDCFPHRPEVDCKSFARWLRWCEIVKPEIFKRTLEQQLDIYAGLRTHHSHSCEKSAGMNPAL